MEQVSIPDPAMILSTIKKCAISSAVPLSTLENICAEITPSFSGLALQIHQISNTCFSHP